MVDGLTIEMNEDCNVQEDDPRLKSFEVVALSKPCNENFKVTGIGKYKTWAKMLENR